jgi:hypothetical protein
VPCTTAPGRPGTSSTSGIRSDCISFVGDAAQAGVAARRVIDSTGLVLVVCLKPKIR